MIKINRSNPPSKIIQSLRRPGFKFGFSYVASEPTGLGRLGFSGFDFNRDNDISSGSFNHHPVNGKVVNQSSGGAMWYQFENGKTMTYLDLKSERDFSNRK